MTPQAARALPAPAPDAPLTPAELAAVNRPPPPTHIQVIPAPEPPADVRPLNTHGKPLPKPDHVWTYRLADGSPYGLVCRWDATAARPKKRVLPAIWDGQTWRNSGFALDPRPVLHLPELSAYPPAPVLVVEGETCCDAARRYLPDGWLVTTWQSGAGAVLQSDWSPLVGRQAVVIWPDNDKPGAECAAKLQAHLAEMGVRATILDLPAGVAEGWDVADEHPDGWDARAAIEETVAKLAREQAAERAAAAPKPKPRVDGPDIHAAAGVRCLGYANQKYYLIGTITQQIHEYRAVDMLKQHTLCELRPESEWLADYGGGKVDWSTEGSRLITSCQLAGIYDPTRVRGLGAWRDGKSVLVHLGDRVLVDGVGVDPVNVKSSYFYPRRPPLLTSAALQPLSDEEGQQLARLCRQLRWARPIYGDLLAGWMGTAPVCGALSWRTHVWLTGPAGSGKSFVVDEMVGRTLSGVALEIQGDSTRAGLEQALQVDARPVIWDEAEGKGERGRARRDLVISLMRQASHDGRGIEVKGSAHHSVVRYQIRSQFLLASIGVGLREGADEDRAVVLTLRAQITRTEEERLANMEHFEALRAAVAALPEDLAPRLFLRLVSMVPTLRANIATFSKAIAEHAPGGRRFGDRLGTLFAGAYALRSSAIVTHGSARAFVLKRLEAGDLAEFGPQGTADNREDQELLRHLLTTLVTVHVGQGGTRLERTIAELIAAALGQETDNRILAPEADEHLKRLGMRRHDEMDPGQPGGPDVVAPGIAFATVHQGLGKLFAGSNYADGYVRIFQRNPGCRMLSKPSRFAGTLSRAIWLPAEEILGV